MRSRLIATLTCFALLVTGLSANAARQTREEMERDFLYGWSSSATLIFYGTVAAVDYIDDPRQRAPHVEVVIRVDSLQRGVPGNSMVRARIEDELQTYRWQGDVSRIGERGLWFLHRIRQYEGAPPRGYLIRHMDQVEMEEDPQFLSELMKYVVQDTIDQAIKPNILNLLTGKNEERETAKMIIDLKYNEIGALDNFEVVERSNNLLFNDHVFDTVLQIHRRIRIPGGVRATRIEVSRSLL
jgi:hypothetical protein